MRFAVQLYTVRDLAKTDFAATVAEVARIGYAGVELAGYGNLASARDVRKACDDSGLAICGAHVGLEAMEKDLGRVIEDQHILGNKTLVCPYLAEPRRKDAAGYRQVAGSLNRIAAEAKKAGLDFAYHNHAFEFQFFDGQTGMDILYGQTDPDLVKAELDVYWLAEGGVDPVAYVKRMGRRVALLHLKDREIGPDGKARFAPVGSGNIDMAAIIAAGDAAGVAWGIVEEDQTYGRPPMDDLRTSFVNLQKLTA